MPGEYPGATNGVSGTVTVKGKGNKLVLDYSLVGLEQSVSGGNIGLVMWFEASWACVSSLRVWRVCFRCGCMMLTMAFTHTHTHPHTQTLNTH